MTVENHAKHTIDPDLAKRLHRALTAGGDELHGVLQDPSQEVLRSALKNRILERGTPAGVAQAP